jgi:hypothetical protein
MGEVLGTPGSVGKYHLARAPIFHPTEETSSHREELLFERYILIFITVFEATDIDPWGHLPHQAMIRI